MNTSSSSTYSTIVWSATLSPNIMNSSGSGVVYTSSSTSATNNVNFQYIIKRCRQCNHAHSQNGSKGCYDVIGSSVTFVICQCSEHVPTDNLEYLEYLLKKKESL